MVERKKTKSSAKARKPRRKKAAKKQTPLWLKYVLALIIIIGVASFGFYRFFVQPYAYRWKTCAGRQAYNVCIPYNYSVHGIDISHYQGIIDWQQLSAHQQGEFPLSFIFMKATEGSDLEDPTFTQHFDSARAHGFLRGAYHFFVPGTDARRQAQFFIGKVHLQTGDLPPVLDVETKGRSKKALQEGVKTWLDVVEAYYGVKPIIYTSYKFKESYLNDAVFNDYPYWIAHYYVDSVHYKGHWEFWQHTDVGSVPGIKENVDLNVFNGTLEQLKRYTLE